MMLALPMAAVTLLLNRELGMAVRGPPPLRVVRACPQPLAPEPRGPRQEHPERVSAYYAAVFSTSLFKPLFGALSDGLPLARWRRRGVMAPACVVAAVCTAALGAAVRTQAGLYVAGVLAALAFCAAEAAADGALVEAAGCAADASALQVAAMSVRTAGGAAGAVAGALLMRLAPARVVICVAAAFGGGAAAASLRLPPPPARVPAPAADNADVAAAAPAACPRARLRAAAQLARRAWRALARAAPASALIFALGATPRSDDAYAAFLTTGLRPPLSDWQFGAALACDTAGALLGTLAYGAVSYGGATRTLLAAGTVAAAAGSLLRLAAPLGCAGLPPPLVVALVAAAVSACSRLAFMPQLVLCAQLAPAGGEAAGFAALVAVSDGGALAGASFSAALTAALRVGSAPGRSWRALPTLVALCAALRLLPLLLLPLLRGGPGSTLPPAAREGAELPQLVRDGPRRRSEELTAPLLGPDAHDSESEADETALSA
jgi:hypothetical protein